MHALHCILVEFEDGELEGAETLDIMKDARSAAMAATEDYRDRAFDWRSEEDAGGWADGYPGPGVVLGAEEPERFRELLREFSRKPLEAALECLDFSRYSRRGWRTKEELEKDPGLVVFRGPVMDGSKEIYFSGLPNPEPLISEEFLERVWREDGPADLNMQAYWLEKSLALARGEYLFDSQFFSVPDLSARVSPGVLEEALESPERFALVFSDYHF